MIKTYIFNKAVGSPRAKHHMEQPHICRHGPALVPRCAVLRHWLGTACRKYDRSVVDPIKTLERTSKSFQSRWILPPVNTGSGWGEKQTPYCWLVYSCCNQQEADLPSLTVSSMPMDPHTTERPSVHWPCLPSGAMTPVKTILDIHSLPCSELHEPEKHMPTPLKQANVNIKASRCTSQQLVRIRRLQVVCAVMGIRAMNFLMVAH